MRRKERGGGGEKEEGGKGMEERGVKKVKVERYGGGSSRINRTGGRKEE